MKFKIGDRVEPKGSHNDNGKPGVITEKFEEEADAWWIKFDDGGENSCHYGRCLIHANINWRDEL